MSIETRTPWLNTGSKKRQRHQDTIALMNRTLAFNKREREREKGERNKVRL